MARAIIYFALIYFFSSCSTGPVNNHLINSLGDSIGTRVKTPPGFWRIAVNQGSFGEYLRNLKLKPYGADVHYYDGKVKIINCKYPGVIDMPIGDRNLQQCADATMRLWAEYLYKNGRENEIHFTFTNGFRCDYRKWKLGYRVSVNGNHTEWVRTATPFNDDNTFRQYLELVFSYCGTLSLTRELQPMHYKDLSPGDVFVKGGLPGHAEIVVDVAENYEGKKIYLLAQASMPAQDIQLLWNPSDPSISPWYELDEHSKVVKTPDFAFTTGQLMRFGDE